MKNEFWLKNVNKTDKCDDIYQINKLIQSIKSLEPDTLKKLRDLLNSSTTYINLSTEYYKTTVWNFKCDWRVYNAGPYIRHTIEPSSETFLKTFTSRVLKLRDRLNSLQHKFQEKPNVNILLEIKNSKLDKGTI